MSKGIYIIIIGAIIIAILGGFLLLKSSDTPEQPDSIIYNPPPVGNGESVTVTYTDSGYSPKEITISQGTKVIFKSASDNFMWPATSIHPTHTIYPGSDILKCGTGEKLLIFDACQALSNGEEWSFVFNESGSWRYHDHLRANHTGKIIVE